MGQKMRGLTTLRSVPETLAGVMNRQKGNKVPVSNLFCPTKINTGIHFNVDFKVKMVKIDDISVNFYSYSYPRGKMSYPTRKKRHIFTYLGVLCGDENWTLSLYNVSMELSILNSLV